MSYRKIIKQLTKQRVLILGYGQEGKSTHRFLRKHFPTKKLFIADRRKIVVDDPHTETISGNKYLDYLTDFDIVFKTPGIPSTLPEIKKALKNGVEFSSATKLFMQLCKGIVIGVTGSKGKSTTTALIGKILKDAAYPVEVVGNIEKPCLDYLNSNLGKGKYFVFELSSHQLADLESSPHIGVFLNIFREHLDYYPTFKEYFRAKTNITKFQKEKDIFIYNADFAQLAKVAANTNASTKSFTLKNNNCDCFYKEKTIYLKLNNKNIKVVQDIEIKLLGSHNLNNVMAASLVAIVLGIPLASLRKSLRNFQPLPDRLQYIGKYRGIYFYSDALATIPEATIAALDVFKGKLGGLIVGGMSRGGVNFSLLAKRILEENLDILVLFPETGNKIYQAMQLVRGKLPLCKFANNMREAVRLCYQYVPKGKVCLLSNASPSFNLFRNYKDKADQFRLYIKSLA